MSSFGFFCIDGIAFFLITWSLLVARHSGLTWPSFRDQLYIYLPIFLFSTFILWLFSFYDVNLLRKRVIAYRRLIIAWVISLIGAASMIYFVMALPFHLPTPRRILVIILLVYFAYIYILRRNYFKLSFAKTNVLIFGNSPTITELIKEMRASRGFKIKESDPLPQADKKYNLKHLDLVIVGSKLFRENPQAWDIIADRFIAKGACVDTDFNAYEHISRCVSHESIQDSIWLLRGIGNRQENAMYGMLKSSFDYFLAILAAPFVFPLCGVIWVWISLVDGEKPIFKQKRVGYLGNEFTIYKFRTITTSTQESEKETLTKTGKFLRRFRLDELPQLWNVLKGELSFVGPRPLWVGEYSLLNQAIPNHTIRSIAKPGITGWAQLNFKAPPNYKTKNGKKSLAENSAFDAAFTRFAYDVWYIKNRSMMLDFEIMIKTGLRMFIKDSNVA